MELLDLNAIVTNIAAQSPLVAFCILALYFTRKDLAEEKADNKELRGHLLRIQEMTLGVIQKNTEANVLLAEKINDLKN